MQDLNGNTYKEIIYRSRMELKEETKPIEGSELEKCVLCGDETNVRVDTHIDAREYYVEGAGELCPKCYGIVYFGSEK